MKKLNLFRQFDWEAFSKNKVFVCTGAVYSESKQMVRVEVAIIQDKTDYGDPTVSNVFEKFNVSIPGTTEADVSKYSELMNQKCLINNVQKVSVYGDYANYLSVTGNVQVIKG